jgi:signal transduction histidine kinase
MFFGGIDGLNAFFPDQVKDSSFLPPVVITAFQKFNQTIRTDLSSGEQIKLSYRDNYISFEFAALDYSAPDKNEYAYQLQGFDKDWVEAGNRRYASYTNLPGGNYVFRVKGTNADGVWNETGSSISITITPPFWETWWFMLFVFGSLIGGTAGVFGLRARNFRVQKERLEEQVAQRTTEIERRTKVAESLRDILVVLNSSRPLEDTLLFIAGQTEHLLACDAVAIYRLDPDNEMLVIQAANGLDFVDHEEVKIGLGEGVTGKAVQSREMVALPDTTELLNEMNNTGGEDDNGAGSSSILIAYRAMLSAPLVMQGVVYGALTLYYREARPFSEEEVDLASTVSEHIALALETARLREQEGQLAVTKERSRLARDLHDAVTQTLFSSSLLAEVLPRLWERNPEEAQRRLAELRQLNRGALAEMRSLLLELRPAALLEADMSELFQHLADAFTGRARIPVQLEMKVDPALGKALPADVKVSLYRITQEALNNIAKHAQAENVRVVVDCEAGQIKLIVQDDGRGFEMRELSGDHFGLGNMRERADNIRAELEITSNPGEGTTVSVTWKAQDLAPEAA